MAMVLILEIPIAVTVLVLSLISFKTIKAIKHLGIGKSFWVPVFCSGIFFLFGSIMVIFSELGYSLTPYDSEVTVSIQLLAFCCLTYGIFTYSRKISKSLGEKLSFSAKVKESEPEKIEKVEKPSTPLRELFAEKRVAETNVACKHELGYLRTLPRRSHIPEECLGCHQIIECKYSAIKKTEKNQESSPERFSPDMTIAEDNLEEPAEKER